MKAAQADVEVFALTQLEEAREPRTAVGSPYVYRGERFIPQRPVAQVDLPRLFLYPKKCPGVRAVYGEQVDDGLHKQLSLAISLPSTLSLEQTV